MLELKITVALDDDTKAIAKQWLNLVETGRIGNVTEPATVKPVEPVKPPRTERNAKPTQTPTDKPNGAESPKTDDQDAPKEVPTEKSYDVEDIRAMLADAKHSHGIEVVRGLLKKYGAATGKLAEVSADKYADLAADIAALGKGEA